MMNSEISTDTTTDSIKLPGRVVHKECISLYTSQATLLVYGRRSQNGVYGIIGLLAYSSIMTRTLIKIAKDHELRKCYEEFMSDKINATTKQLNTMSQFLDETIENSDVAIHEDNIYSQEPHNLNIEFSTPLAYRTVGILVTFDRYIAKGVVAMKKGAWDVDVFNLHLKKANKLIRSLLSYPNQWNQYKKKLKAKHE